MKPLSRVLTALLAPLAVLLLAGAPAAAHGGEGEIEIMSITRSGPRITVDVHLRYVEDGHGVPDATITVVMNEGTPIPMEAGPEEGDYTLSIPAPPGAALRVTSVEPATSIEAEAPAVDEQTPTTAEGSTTSEADGSTTSEEGGSTTSEGDTASTDDVPTTQAPAETAPEPNGVDEAPADDEGSGGTVIVLVVVVVVIVAALAAGFLLRRKRPGQV